MIHGRRIDIHPAYFAMTVPGAVNRAHLFGDEVGVIFRMFSKHQDQPFLARSLQLQYLFAQLRGSQRAPYRECVAALKAAVGTIVDAVIPNIKRSKQNNPVAVDSFLKRLGGMKHFVEQFGSFARRRTAVSSTVNGRFSRLFAMISRTCCRSGSGPSSSCIKYSSSIKSTAPRLSSIFGNPDIIHLAIGEAIAWRRAS